MSMTVDPRQPVIIGVSQIAYAEPRLDSPPDAIDLMSEAIAAAIVDTGGSGVTAAIDTLAVVAGLFSFRDPAALIAAEIGADNARTVLTTMGGNTPITFAGELSDRIARGDVDVAVMVSGENNASRRALKKQGRRIERRPEPPHGHMEAWGPTLDMGNETDTARGGEFARNTYAVMDSAIRARRGESLDVARDRAAALWAGYAEVAAGNPHAADRSGMTAAEIRRASPSNRMVSWPYTKAMCANNHVDQAGAVIIASHEAADRLGVPADQRVYVHDTLSTIDTDSILTRQSLDRVPALGLAADQIADRWGPLSEIAHLDFYGCFPSVVTLSCETLGVSPDRQLTVTGGLGFAGAPLNFAAGQSLVGMVQVLRDNPTSRGVVQGNGGHASKHSFGLYSAQPPEHYHFATITYDESPTVDQALPDRTGPVVIDGATVEHDSRGPARAVLACRFDDGSRTWANSAELAVMDAIETEETVGGAGSVRAGLFSF
jgi:acetyl-CoA C-acetyltransferase